MDLCLWIALGIVYDAYESVDSQGEEAPQHEETIAPREPDPPISQIHEHKHAERQRIEEDSGLGRDLQRHNVPKEQWPFQPAKLAGRKRRTTAVQECDDVRRHRGRWFGRQWVHDNEERAHKVA